MLSSNIKTYYEIGLIIIGYQIVSAQNMFSFSMIHNLIQI